MAAFEDANVTSIPHRMGGRYVIVFPPRECLERTEREHPDLLLLESLFRTVPPP